MRLPLGLQHRHAAAALRDGIIELSRIIEGINERGQRCSGRHRIWRDVLHIFNLVDVGIGSHFDRITTSGSSFTVCRFLWRPGPFTWPNDVHSHMLGHMGSLNHGHARTFLLAGLSTMPTVTGYDATRSLGH
jgi:hypothetical protein